MSAIRNREVSTIGRVLKYYNNSPSIGTALSVRYLEVFIKGGSTVDGGSFQYFHHHSICKPFIIAMHNDVLLDASFIAVLHKLVLTEQEENKQFNCVLVEKR